MRRLWVFVAYSYPPTAPKTMKRRIPFGVRQDLIWWNRFLPDFNGVLFFDKLERENVILYTDATLEGLAGFFYKNDKRSWEHVTVSQECAFISKVRHLEPCQKRKNVANRELRGVNPDINIHEVEAVLLAFQTFAQKWPQYKAIIYTDNTSVKSEIDRSTLKGPANTPLRELFFVAAKFDIILEARWIPSEANGLADALSRFDAEKVANLCSHWQNPFLSMLLPNPTCGQLQDQQW